MAKRCIRKGWTAALIPWLRGQGVGRGCDLPHRGSGGRPRSQTTRLGADLPSWGRLTHSSAARSRLAPWNQLLCSKSSASPSSWGPNVLAISLLPPVPACSHHCSSSTITPPPLPTRIRAGPSLGAWHWGGHRSAARGLSLTLVSTNLRVNRARPVSKAHQGHQAPLDQVDLWGIQDCQGLWGHL